MENSDRSRLPFFGALRRNLRASRAFTLSALVLSLPLLGAAEASKEARYPYDPACPWGRLANGKGMLHRCLSEAEAVALAKGEAPEPVCSEKAPVATDDVTEPSLDGEQRSLKDFEITVGPITADQGEITVGRLGAPMDRYRECVVQGGGLKEPQAKVVVKFLVRGERVRAEGAGVESFEGVSEEVAKCIAFVVDRRRVGAPSVPLTGAHLTFQLESKTPLQN